MMLLDGTTPKYGDVIRWQAAQADQAKSILWAEGLILQLPITHDGRNSWLLNNGKDLQAEWLRNNHAKLQDLSSVEHTDYLTKSLQSIVDKSNCPNKPLAHQAAQADQTEYIAMLELNNSFKDEAIAQLQETLQVIEDGLEADKALTEALKKVDANTIAQLQLENKKMKVGLQAISKINWTSEKDYDDLSIIIKEALATQPTGIEVQND